MPKAAACRASSGATLGQHSGKYIQGKKHAPRALPHVVVLSTAKTRRMSRIAHIITLRRPAHMCAARVRESRWRCWRRLSDALGEEEEKRGEDEPHGRRAEHQQVPERHPEVECLCACNMQHATILACSMQQTTCSCRLVGSCRQLRDQAWLSSMPKRPEGLESGTNAADNALQRSACTRTGCKSMVRKAPANGCEPSHRCSRGEPNPGADVGWVSPVLVQMGQG